MFPFISWGHTVGDSIPVLCGLLHTSLQKTTAGREMAAFPQVSRCEWHYLLSMYMYVISKEFMYMGQCENGTLLYLLFVHAHTYKHTYPNSLPFP